MTKPKPVKFVNPKKTRNPIPTRTEMIRKKEDPVMAKVTAVMFVLWLSIVTLIMIFCEKQQP